MLEPGETQGPPNPAAEASGQGETFFSDEDMAEFRRDSGPFVNSVNSFLSHLLNEANRESDSEDSMSMLFGKPGDQRHSFTVEDLPAEIEDKLGTFKKEIKKFSCRKYSLL